MHQRAITLALVSLGVAVALAFAWPAAAGATSWRAPTDGRVTRAFSFDAEDGFAPGRHRGADFAAARGAPVRAPCRGRVVVARRIGTNGGGVTIACGRYRVSVLSLERISTQFGARVTPGALVGAAGQSRAHDGVHLGVRRAGKRFGYVDPLPFLDAPTHLPPVTPFTGPRATKPRRSAPSPLRAAGHNPAAARAPPPGHSRRAPRPTWD